MRIGTGLPFSRMARQITRPVFPGRSRSRTIASYSLRTANASAFEPVAAWSTAYDSSRRPRAMDALSCRLSSASRMRMEETYRPSRTPPPHAAFVRSEVRRPLSPVPLFMPALFMPALFMAAPFLPALLLLLLQPLPRPDHDRQT